MTINYTYCGQVNMDTIRREEFLRSRRRQLGNDAARFIENRVSIPGRLETVYCEQLDSFEEVHEAAKHQRIR